MANSNDCSEVDEKRAGSGCIDHSAGICGEFCKSADRSVPTRTSCRTAIRQERRTTPPHPVPEAFSRSQAPTWQRESSTLHSAISVFAPKPVQDAKQDGSSMFAGAFTAPLNLMLRELDVERDTGCGRVFEVHRCGTELWWALMTRPHSTFGPSSKRLWPCERARCPLDVVRLIE